MNVNARVSEMLARRTLRCRVFGCRLRWIEVPSSEPGWGAWGCKRRCCGYLRIAMRVPQRRQTI